MAYFFGHPVYPSSSSSRRHVCIRNFLVFCAALAMSFAYALNVCQKAAVFFNQNGGKRYVNTLKVSLRSSDMPFQQSNNGWLFFRLTHLLYSSTYRCRLHASVFLAVRHRPTSILVLYCILRCTSSWGATRALGCAGVIVLKFLYLTLVYAVYFYTASTAWHFRNAGTVCIERVAAAAWSA